MMLAASRTAGGLRLGQLLLILICMVTARTFAMLANRYFDAEVDAQNPRTARRVLPSGQVSPRFMFLAMIASAAIFIAAAGGFQIIYHNPWPLLLAIPVLAFLVGYPFLKRFSRFCHYYLGTALALAPVCAWLAIAGRVQAPAWCMFAAVLLWTAGFDILYACQDYQFDVTHGLFSIPAKIGIPAALWIARATHFACLGFILLLGLITPELHNLYWIGAIIAAILLFTEHLLIKPNDLSKITLAFFTLNGIISLMLGTLGTLDIIFRH